MTFFAIATFATKPTAQRSARPAVTKCVTATDIAYEGRVFGFKTRHVWMVEMVALGLVHWMIVAEKGNEGVGEVWL
jgi:hypothetical protein